MWLRGVVTAGEVVPTFFSRQAGPRTVGAPAVPVPGDQLLATLMSQTLRLGRPPGGQRRTDLSRVQGLRRPVALEAGRLLEPRHADLLHRMWLIERAKESKESDLANEINLRTP
ncbi:hypothetical protein GCM10010503_36590 [Streptomyces lucensis JCM 4490]|uniref:Uncharacterized protein n=1 Tax=Streptomyces lucensis JCM 4490 TaxID=1306176 RepID=A0A918J7N2_9ACTN|nr:hypothetical protein GCM10010503_36590 [Streptomyces lucensis JCM 4490]